MDNSKISKKRRLRLFLTILLAVIYFFIQVISNHFSHRPNLNQPLTNQSQSGILAQTALLKLEVKGRAPKNNYDRKFFGAGWGKIKGCTLRNIILNRDLDQVTLDNNCNVLTGVLKDPYSGKTLNYWRDGKNSDRIDIDHVVALADAWQKGAQQLDQATRVQLANDPLELLAVDSSLNIQKGASDVASWLPPNKAFRCQYVARQIAVKKKYKLWVTLAEREAMQRVLEKCPEQALPE